MVENNLISINFGVSFLSNIFKFMMIINNTLSSDDFLKLV